jgi:hypothetical protein
MPTGDKYENDLVAFEFLANPFQVGCVARVSFKRDEGSVQIRGQNSAVAPIARSKHVKLPLLIESPSCGSEFSIIIHV